METEITEKTSGRKIAFIILVILVSAFLIYYSIMSMVSPGRRMAELKKEFELKPANKSLVDDKVLSDSAYLKLLKEKAFLQARTILAETDSIYLTINLADSTANIEINGVVVHVAKINSFRISNILMKGDENVISTLLSTPLTIAKSYSTIKKEPVMIKMAPKDTSEYKPDIMPDTTIVVPVNYKLEMSNGMNVYVYQENEKTNDRINQFSFDIKDRISNAWHSLKHVMVFKVPDYKPFIKIRISRSDAKIIYRALPRNGQIAIYR
jgi:hypothetical protein